MYKQERKITKSYTLKQHCFVFICFVHSSTRTTKNA